MRIGIITGLPIEAEIVRKVASELDERSRPLIASALGSVRAYEAAGKLVGEGAGALLSFGMAGALDTSLATGQVVVSGHIRNENGEALQSDLGWFSAALNLLADVGAEHADLLTTSSVIADADAKARLRVASSAGAVDMESFGIARAAGDAGIPFLGVRVILDTAMQTIPPSALAGMSENGEILPARVISSLLRSPTDFISLVGLALASRKAQKMLGRVAGAGLPTFGFSQFGGRV